MQAIQKFLDRLSDYEPSKVEKMLIALAVQALIVGGLYLAFR